MNPIFRRIQFWTDTPYVIASISQKIPDNGYYFIKYKIMRVKYIRST